MTILTLPRTIMIAAATGLGGYFLGKANPPPPAPMAASTAHAVAASRQPVAPEAADQPAETTTPEKAPASTSTTISAELDSKLSSLLGQMRNPGEMIPSLTAWLAENPDEAVAYLSSSAQRDTTFQQMFALWARKDSLAASQWVAGHPNAPGRDAMAAGLSAAVANEDAQAALQWAASIKDPVLKVNAAADAAFELYRASETAALDGVKGLGLPSSALATLQAKWENQFKAQTRRNAQNIASTASASRAAGAKINATNLAEVVAALQAGINGSGPFKTTRFQLSSEKWTEREWAAIEQHVTMNAEGMLQYQAGE